MIRLSSLILVTGFALGPLGPSASASVPDLMRQAAADLRREGAPGVAMAVVVDGRTYYLNIGSSGHPGLPVTEHTLFETASISKVFITTLLGMDVARGKKTLHDRIGKYLRGRPLQPRMRNATLEMLATFTAGFPGVPPDFRKLPSDEQGIHSYRIADFLRFVGRWQPATPLPAPRFYSDASVGLLGLCLANLSLDGLEGRLRREIFQPLQMPDTSLFLDSAQAGRLAAGTRADGSPAPAWPVDAFAAADGVKSTAWDLGHFVAALLGRRADTPATVRAGLRIATDTGFPIFNGNGFQALAWTWAPVEVHGARLWVVTKNGNIPGFSSQVSFNRGLGIGAAILTNRGDLPIRAVEIASLQGIARERN